MRIRTIVGIVVGLLFIVPAAYADAPLKSKLGLDVDQAKVVSEIQAKYRKQKRSVRQDLNRESRKLRRARSANDSETIAQQEPIVAGLEGQMREQIRAEDDEIRKVLSPEQLEKFEAYLQVRDDMVGSSRDVRVGKN
ncbi:MAG: Spy/CpxP family protein refolding chaperone [Myxococcota bacterium]